MDNIIQEIRSGNKEAFKEVYQQYAKDVYNFAKSITGDHDTALAATKKTFLTLFQNIKNGDEPDNLRTAALKIAYKEAYSMVAPAAEEEPAAEVENAPAEERVKEEAVHDKPAEEATAQEPSTEEPVYAESMFQPRKKRNTEKITPIVDGYDDEYDDPYERDYEEEEDDFVPPSRKSMEEREDVYIPKGGYDTLKIEPVNVEEEQNQMRRKRRRRPVKQNPDEEYIDAPRSRKNDYDDEFADEPEPEKYDDDDFYDDEPKPRRTGLFVFCIILNVVLILILLWFLGGLLVNLGILPSIDLGYSWFNSHIYPLF